MNIANNLNFLRFLAALMVLYGHAFVFLGLPEPVFMGWVPLGPLGVYIFFSISGYLIAQSWESDPNVLRFLQRRALRIFPGLIVCTVLSVVVLGPFATTLPIWDYFSHSHTRGYFTNIYLYITYHLPGVFEANRVPNAVNGSLWSLPVEFFMYLAMAILGLIRVSRYGWAVVAIGLMLASKIWAMQSPDMLVIYRTDFRQVVICGVYFSVGAFFYQYRIAKLFSTTNVIIAIIVWVCLTRWMGTFVVASWVMIPFLTLAFGLASNSWLSRITRFDYSYGIYIYAFPIQQLIAQIWPNISIGTYLCITGAATLGIAALSWHLVESPALKLKPGRGNKPKAANRTTIKEKIESSFPNAISLLFPIGHFYSPIADPVDISARQDKIWRNEDAMPSIDMATADQMELLLQLKPFTAGIAYPISKPESETSYYYNNDQYPVLDAEFLYAALCHFKPKVMIEVGSGFSSLVTADVNRRILDSKLDFTCIEPFPRQFLIDGIDGITCLVQKKVEDVELSFFDRLGSGDILFIDSSHVSKVGSDVNYLFFEVLPRLKKGVIVHIHDIFLPDEYPKNWVIEQGRNWNEQYLTRAFLSFNKDWKILWAAHYMGTRHTAIVQNTFPRYPQLGGGGSLWLSRL